MDKTTLGVLGAISALAAFGAASAAPVAPAKSFAELFDPIPNAVARLKADDEVRKATPPAQDTAEEEDPSCRPMSRAGCFRPSRPAPVEAPAKTPPAEQATPAGQGQPAPASN